MCLQLLQFRVVHFPVRTFSYCTQILSASLLSYLNSVFMRLSVHREPLLPHTTSSRIIVMRIYCVPDAAEGIASPICKRADVSRTARLKWVGASAADRFRFKFRHRTTILLNIHLRWLKMPIATKRSVNR